MKSKEESDRKGKWLRGERHPRAKLTADAVRAIRAEYAEGVSGYEKLAAKHGVSMAAVQKIINRKAWRHVDGMCVAQIRNTNGPAKLTAENVRAIRREYANGSISQERLAEKYRVGHTAIGSVVTRKRWKGIADLTGSEILQWFQSSYRKPLDPARKLSALDAFFLFGLRNQERDTLQTPVSQTGTVSQEGN